MPVVSILELEEFRSLFAGRTDAYGVHEPGTERDESGKLKGKSYTRTSALTATQYADHLAGKTGLGVIPIREDDKCYFGAIDVDEYNGERDRTVSIIYQFGLPLVPFRSKSGGLHLFLFFQKDSPILAAKVIPILQELRDLLGLPPKTEIFPKQKTAASGYGNWINLPYFGESDRGVIGKDGRVMGFAEAMSYMEERRFNEDGVARIFEGLAFSDGPPCLQTLFLQGIRKNRNNYLFSAARYFKSKYGIDEFEGQLKDLNAALPDPLEEEELDKTVIATHRKKDYSYKCSDTPLCDVCNKGKCKGRRFGVGNNEVSELSFGTMVQYLGDPPYYTWEVSGKEFKFYDENDIIKQVEFQRQCFRHLHYKPAQLKQQAWDAIVNGALRSMETRGVDQLNEISMGAMFRSYFVEFLTQRSMAANRSQILLNRVYEDHALGKYVFQAMDYARYLTETKRFKAYSFPEIQDKLREMGAEQVADYKVDERNKKLKVWLLPFTAIKDMLVDRSAVEDIEFLIPKEEY